MKTHNIHDLKLAGEGLKVALVGTLFNRNYVTRLRDCVMKELIALGVNAVDLDFFEVAGALELPLFAKGLCYKDEYDVIVCLGAVVRGETTHYELVTENCYRGLMEVQLHEDLPIVFGVLTCEDEKQLEDRINPKKMNKGKEFALTAVHQALLWQKYADGEFE